MSIILDGIAWGLVLSGLIGAIFIVLIQTSLEEGVRAGLLVGLGIWMSDIAYILLVYFGFSYAEALSTYSGFELWVGIVGGIILMLFGITSLITPPPNMDKLSGITTSIKEKIGFKKIREYWLKGFIINTFNPFTLFFWFTMMTKVVIADELLPFQVALFFGSVVGTIILTDGLKVVLSKKLSSYLSPLYIQWFRRLSGSVLIAFGIFLIVRVSF